MGTKKGQVRKTARRAYERKGPRNPEKFKFFAIGDSGDLFGWFGTKENIGKPKTAVRFSLEKSRRKK